MITTVLPIWVFESDLFTSFWQEKSESVALEIQQVVEENHMTVEEVREYITNDIGRKSVIFYSYINYQPEICGRSTNVEVICSDGIFYPKGYVPSNDYWDGWNYVGIFIAFVFSELVILSYVYRLVCRMKKLYNQIVSSDVKKKDSVIGIRGRDELSLLGEKVENMRTMLIQYLDDEMKQKQQQKELIASLSHDIRTPLTKIITCLDILNYKIAKTEEEKEHCIDMITNKANQLKALTDTLLNSVSYGNEYSIYHLEFYDGPSMLSQLMFEGSYYLEEVGFEVHMPETITGNYQLYVDMVSMRRVADNLHSNIQKYADEKFPIEIWIEESDKEVIVYVQNHKKQESCEAQQESYGIGLATITQIMNEMGGKIEKENTDELFTIKLRLPKHNSVM